MDKTTRPVTLAGMVLIVLAFAACQGQPAPSPVPPTATSAPATRTLVVPTATPVPKPTATTPSPEAILQAAFDATKRASSYRFDMNMRMSLATADSNEATEIPIVFSGDVQAPDRMQGTMTMSVNGVETETPVIVLGGTSYVRSPLTGRWQTNPQATALFNPEDLVLDASDIRALRLSGEEIVEGVPVYHLTGQTRLPFNFEEPLGKIESDMLVNYWVRQADHRLVRSTSEGDMAFTGQVKASATISMTMWLYDYDAPVQISAPEIGPADSITVPGVGPIVIKATLLAPLQSDTPEGHAQRALASLADGRLGLAAAHFDRALALRPDWTDGLLYRGATLAIHGSMDASLADLDRAIEAQPDRADAYALRAWARLRGIVRGETESGSALPQARADIARALELDPKLTMAAGLEASADMWEALDLMDSNPVKATALLEGAKVDAEAVLRQDPDAAAAVYFSVLTSLAQLKIQDRAWLTRQVDDAGLALSKNPKSYVDYGVQGLVKLLLGSQPTPNVETLREAGDDLLRSIALAHDHMPVVADPTGGPLQVAKIWDLQEAAYLGGDLYTQVFFNQGPRLFPEFANMLTSYWELQDLFTQIVDDPIIFSVAFSPDGRQIATLSESGPSYLRLWDANGHQKLQEVELRLDGRVIATTVGNLAYSPDGSRIAVAYQNPVVRVIDANTGEVTAEISHTMPVHSVAFSPDGKRIVTVDPDTDAPAVWDTDTGERLSAVEAGSPVGAAAFSPDGSQIVGGGEKVQFWNAETGEALGTLPGFESSYVHSPAISPDGRLVAVPGSPVRVYDLNTKKELFTIPLGARTVAFSPDGRRIATGGFDTAGVWNAKTGDLVFLAGHTGGADSAAFSPDGRLLVTGGPDGRFRVWDAQTGAELWTATAATLWWEAAD